MYDSVALDLSYVNHSLPRHYESDEEDISESESHSHSRSATLDSIASVSDMDRPALPRLLPPFTTSDKPSRPVSMDTVKRSSSATFVTEPCTIFDNDDDMILELPSPDPTTPLQSPLFLQPTVYVPSEPLTSPRNSFQSSSSGSVYSDDDSDVFVAEQVTYVEHAKPSLILISPTATEQSSPSPRDLASPSSDGSVYSNDEAAQSQPVLGETSMDRGRSRYYPTRPVHGKTQGSLSALDTLQKCSARESSREPMSAPAVEARRLSFRARSMSFSRPQTPATDRRRLQKEPPRRPPSAQSTATTATFSLFPTQSQTKPPTTDEEARARSASISYSHSAASSTYSLSSSQPPSRTESPSPYFNPYNRSRSGSLYSVASTTTATAPATGKRPAFPLRTSLMKSSTFSGNPGLGYSASSLRAELGNGSVNVDEHDPHASQEDQIDDSKSKTRRKKSMKQLKPTHSSKDSESSAKSFVGFMLRGKRKSVIKSSNA